MEAVQYLLSSDLFQRLVFIDDSGTYLVCEGCPGCGGRSAHPPSRGSALHPTSASCRPGGHTGGVRPIPGQTRGLDGVLLERILSSHCSLHTALCSLISK